MLTSQRKFIRIENIFKDYGFIESMSKSNRPLGITILLIFVLICGVILLSLSIIALMAFISILNSPTGWEPTGIGTSPSSALSFSLPACALSFLIAYGFLKKISWTYWLYIAISIIISISIFLYILLLLSSLVSSTIKGFGSVALFAEGAKLYSGIIILIIFVPIIYYLRRPNVRKWFNT